MAAALFENSLNENQKKELQIKSAGVATFGQDLATENAIKVMQSKGIDISSHRSTPLKLSDLYDTNLFVCMTNEHKKVLQVNDVAEDKILCLDIFDPYGQDLSVYESCANEIEKKLQAVREKLNL